MKIGILSRNRTLYSTRRLLESGRQAGHHVDVFDTLAIAIKVGGARRRRLPDVEAIIPRIGASITFYGVAVVRQFESQEILTTANAEGIAASRNKLQSLQLMEQAGLPTPITSVATHPADLWPAIQAVGGLPVVIKLLRGTQGRGVFLAFDIQTVQNILRTVRQFEEQLLVQQFIAEAEGSDIRVIVVGNRCVAAMKRTAAQDDFRSNLHRGGTASTITLEENCRRLALQAARVHGLGVAGVDILPSQSGPLLLEVNSSPGLEGIERTTGIDVAREIIRYLEIQQRKKKRSGRIR